MLLGAHCLNEQAKFIKSHICLLKLHYVREVEA